MTKHKQLAEEISYELENLFDKLPRSTFEEIPGHDFIDTCDIYRKVFQKYRANLKSHKLDEREDKECKHIGAIFTSNDGLTKCCAECGKELSPTPQPDIKEINSWFIEENKDFAIQAVIQVKDKLNELIRDRNKRK